MPKRFNQSTRYLPQLVLAVILLVAHLVTPSFAQLAPATGSGSQPEPIADSLGRNTPRGSVEGYIKAIRDSDFSRAAQYLDVSNHPLGKRKGIAEQRARELIKLLDRDGYLLDVNLLSLAEEGSTGDGLAAGVDQVGVLDRSSRNLPLLLHRRDAAGGLKIWLFEPKMLDRVPFLLRVTDEGLLDRWLPESLKTEKLGSVAIGHWLAIGLAAIFALAIGYLTSWSIVWLLRRAMAKRSDIPGKGILSSIVIPLGVVIAVTLYRLIVINIGVQLVARDAISWIATICSFLAIAWLAMRIVDGIADIVRYGMSRSSRLTSVAVVMLARRLAKAVILGVVTITILDVVGFDVTTGLAALGIGGIALALGAQRTIENLVGSITVVADKPISVGDFCQFGDVTGTVEDIGIRSTRLRTLDRTVVTIPNGVFASSHIENYTARDEFKFQTTLTLRYETTTAQIRFLLEKIRKILIDDERVNNNPARVRFVSLNSHSIDIEIFCYIRCLSYNAFLEIQEELLLQVMDVVAESGTDFAFPSQTLYFGRDHAPSPEDAERIAQLVNSGGSGAGDNGKA